MCMCVCVFEVSLCEVHILQGVLVCGESPVVKIICDFMTISFLKLCVPREHLDTLVNL